MACLILNFCTFLLVLFCHLLDHGVGFNLLNRRPREMKLYDSVSLDSVVINFFAMPRGLFNLGLLLNVSHVVMRNHIQYLLLLNQQ